MKNDELFEPEESKRPYIGRFYIHGKGVINGVIGLKKLNESLGGIIDVIDFYSTQENKFTKRKRENKNFDIPIVIKKGSVEVNFQDIMNFLNVSSVPILCGLGIFSASYLTEKGKELAKKGIGEFIKNNIQILKKRNNKIEDILNILIVVIQTAQFIGGIGETACDENNITVRTTENGVELLRRGTKDHIFISLKEYEIFIKTPPDLLKRLFSVITDNIDLTVETIDLTGIKKIAKVTEETKNIFCNEEDLENDDILPELIHGEDVILDGSITRANDATNSIGFQYKNHIITCYPRSQNISDFFNVLINKNGDTLFQKSVCIKGTIDRKSLKSDHKHYRPNLIFDALDSIEDDFFTT